MIVRSEREVGPLHLKEMHLDWPDMVDAFDEIADDKDYKPGAKDRGGWDSFWCDGPICGIRPLLIRGYPEGVDAARKYMDEVAEHIPMETLGRELSPAPIGYIPIVPSFLAGRPDSMLGLDEDYSPEGTLRIFMSVSASGAATKAQLAKRAAAVLALVEAVQMIRPVELFVFHGVGSSNTPHSSLVLVRIGVTPLDISEAAAAMHTLVYRGAFFQLSRKRLESPSDSFPSSKISMQRMVDANDEDVVVPQLWHPGSDEILKEPAAWVKARVEEAIKGTGEARAGFA